MVWSSAEFEPVAAGVLTRIRRLYQPGHRGWCCYIQVDDFAIEQYIKQLEGYFANQ